jgi:hypothetical protein
MSSHPSGRCGSGAFMVDAKLVESLSQPTPPVLTAYSGYHPIGPAQPPPVTPLFDMAQIAVPSSRSKHGKTRTESLPRKYSSMCWARPDGESACNSRSGGLCESQYPACGPSSRSLCFAEPAPGFRGRPRCRAPNPSCKPTGVS